MALLSLKAPNWSETLPSSLVSTHRVKELDGNLLAMVSCDILLVYCYEVFVSEKSGDLFEWFVQGVRVVEVHKDGPRNSDADENKVELPSNMIECDRCDLEPHDVHQAIRT